MPRVRWSRAEVGLRGGIRMIIGDKIGMNVVKLAVVPSCSETVYVNRKQRHVLLRDYGFVAVIM